MNYPVQFWQFKSKEDPTKCLHVAYNTATEGQNVDVQPCEGSSESIGTKYWEYNPNANSLAFRTSGYCINPEGGGFGTNNNVHLWACSNQNSQKTGFSGTIGGQLAFNTRNGTCPSQDGSNVKTLYCNQNKYFTGDFKTGSACLFQDSPVKNGSQCREFLEFLSNTSDPKVAFVAILFALYGNTTSGLSQSIAASLIDRDLIGSLNSSDMNTIFKGYDISTNTFDLKNIGEFNKKANGYNFNFNFTNSNTSTCQLDPVNINGVLFDFRRLCNVLVTWAQSKLGSTCESISSKDDPLLPECLNTYFKDQLDEKGSDLIVEKPYLKDFCTTIYSNEDCQGGREHCSGYYSKYAPFCRVLYDKLSEPDKRGFIQDVCDTNNARNLIKEADPTNVDKTKGLPECNCFNYQSHPGYEKIENNIEPVFKQAPASCWVQFCKDANTWIPNNYKPQNGGCPDITYCNTNFINQNSQIIGGRTVKFKGDQACGNTPSPSPSPSPSSPPSPSNDDNGSTRQNRMNRRRLIIIITSVVVIILILLLLILLL